MKSCKRKAGPFFYGRPEGDRQMSVISTWLSVFLGSEIYSVFFYPRQRILVPSVLGRGFKYSLLFNLRKSWLKCLMFERVGLKHN